jgi:patatin-like phospholipase/acyl hydrolase
MFRRAFLSFDGGGIRGLAALLLLRDVMNNVGQKEKARIQEERHINGEVVDQPIDQDMRP